MLYIKDSTIYTPNEVIGRGAALVEGGLIVAVGPADDVLCCPGADVIDATGLILAPGFVDLQINGAFGDDFTDDPTTIWRVAEQLPRYGVTSFLPTIITSPPEKIAAGRQVVLAERPDGFRGARPLGLHIEGPFLNPQKRGAHNPKYLRQPDVAAVADWSPATGVRLVTLAPELPGALEVIGALAARGVLVGLGHSVATYDQAEAAFDAGARYGTHLFNAMSPLGHRDPGLADALLTDERATVGFVADGVHTHPAVIKLAWQALGGGRLNLVTDAMAALGMPPGRYLLGDLEVTVDTASARLADGTLAGSVLSLDQALRNLIAAAGCTLAQALLTVTATPARAIGLDGERGRIAPGCLADMVLLSSDLHVHSTFCGGVLSIQPDDHSQDKSAEAQRHRERVVIMGQIAVKWAGDDSRMFLGRDSLGRTVVAGYWRREDDERWTEWRGARASELLVIALCSCSGYDVVDILQKQKVGLTGLTVIADAEQAADPPWPFTRIHLHYVVTGHDLDPKKIERAIKLSEEKYCSVAATIRGVAQITHDFEVQAA